MKWNKSTPPVVGRQIRYSKYGSDTYKYYSDNGWYDYVTREEAICNEIETDIVNKSHTHEQLLNISDIAQQPLKEYGTVFDYYSKRPGSTGLFGPEGKISLDEIKETKKSMRKTKATFIDGVWSLDSDFAAQYEITTEKAAMEITQSCIETLIKGYGMEPSNVNWRAAFHKNTDNPHVHFLIWEKEPKRLNYKTGKYEFTDSGKMSKNSRNKAWDEFKYKINSYIKNNSLMYHKLNSLRNSIAMEQKEDTLTWNEIKKIYQGDEDNQLSKKFNQLLEHIPAKGRLQYNSSNFKRARKYMDSFLDEFINTTNIKTVYQEYEALLDNQQQEMIDESLTNKVRTDLAINYKSNRIEHLKSAIANNILKFIKKEIPDSRKGKRSPSIARTSNTMFNERFGLNKKKTIKWNIFDKLMVTFNRTIAEERHNSLSTFYELQSKSIFEQLYKGKGK
ncbi:relaxase MobL [Spiroplasma sp. DGKH1]|uniref:relaxase MobL n=1 Tax=Spiroplasma sp. DGKH1 TaxID=3050074 RepID=UPI0034C62815